MFMQAGQEEEEVIVGSFDTYKAEADKFLLNREFRKAIDIYTTALKLRPEDRMCLVARSKCYLKLGDYTKALKDAEASLVEDKNYYRGIFQKAEALFNKGDFEMALVFYHRGHNIRPELHIFRLGIKKAQEAILNCVGTPSRVKLNTSGDLSFFKQVEPKKLRKKGQNCTKKQQVVVTRVRPMGKQGNERTIKQMLGDLYGDRLYLEKLLRETDQSTVTGNNMRNIAQRGLLYLDRQKDFWQQVNPVYARNYEKRLALKRVKSTKIATHDYVLGQLHDIDDLMARGQFEESLRKSVKLMTVLDKYPERQLSCKMIFTAAVHSAIGSAYLGLKDYENAEKHHLLDLKLGEDEYIDEAERRALDNLGRVYVASGNYQKAIDVWERKLPMSRDALERTWLCHELGNCFLNKGDCETAKVYGERSLTAALEAKDDRWQLHALVLIARAEAKSKRFSSSLINFERALEMAQLLRDAGAISTITAAMDAINDNIWQREINFDFDNSLFKDFLIPKKKRKFTMSALPQKF